MKKSDAFKEMLGKIWNVVRKFITHNWGFKLLAVLIAIFLWSFLIASDETLVREKVFSGVTISVTGQDTAKRNGYIITSDIADLPLGTIKVDVPQKQYERAQPSTFNLRADFSKIKEEGTQEIRLSTTNSASYGTVTSVYPETITVNVESYVTRYRIPVTAIVTGSAGDGFYATSPSLDPPSVRISGPRSQVSRVARIEVQVDQSQLPKAEGTYQTAYPFKLVDVNGEEISSRQIEVTSESVLLDSIVAEQTVYEKKELEMSTVGIVTGEPAHGYEIKSIKISPEKVTAAGKHAALEIIDSLFTDSKIDITDKTQSVQTNVTIRRPSEISYISTNVISVTVEIGESSTQRVFKDVKISATGFGSGLTASLSDKYATVYVTGPTNAVEALRSGNILVTADMTGLESGEYHVPLAVEIQSDNADQFTVATSPETLKAVVYERK